MLTTQKSIPVVINGRAGSVPTEKVSYNDIVLMSAENDEKRALLEKFLNSGGVFSVTYDKGPKDDREGSIVKGGSLNVVPGMIINAHRTDNA